MFRGSLFNPYKYAYKDREEFLRVKAEFERAQESAQARTNKTSTYDPIAGRNPPQRPVSTPGRVLDGECEVINIHPPKLLPLK